MPLERKGEIPPRQIPLGNDIKDFKAWEQSFRMEINRLRYDSRGLLPRQPSSNERINEARGRLRSATRDSLAYCDSISNATIPPQLSPEDAEQLKIMCRSAELSLGIGKRALEELKKLNV